MARALTATLLLMLAQGAVVADDVYLTSGARVSGLVLESGDRVRVEVARPEGAVVLSFPVSRVAAVLAPGALEERLARALKQLEHQEHVLAEPELRALIALEPRHAGIRCALARCLYESARPVEALRTLEHYTALVSENRDPEPLLLHAEYLLAQGNLRDARRVAREAGETRPRDTELGKRADELVRRIDRSRTGAEQARERELAAQAEIAARRESRAQWDRAAGNNAEAARASTQLVNWSTETDAQLVLALLVDIGAPDDATAAWQAGGEDGAYQGRVSRVQATVTVNESRWLAMYDHQKAMLVNGWFYLLRERYPRATPVVTVQAKVREGSAIKDKVLARGSWDGRRDQVTVDRYTRENRDPARPRRVVR